MPTTALTDAKVRSLKPRPKPYKVFDGKGLHLYLSPTGAKVWRLAYRLHGKPQTMSFGPYPEVSLVAARGKRDEARERLRAGADPMQPRRAARGALTLKDACEGYWRDRQDISADYRKNIQRAFEMHVYPVIGERSVAGLTRDDFMDVFKPMNAKELFDYVRKVRGWLRQPIDWCVEHGEAAVNHVALIKPEKAFGKRKQEHFASVPLSEVGALLYRIRMEGELQSALACRLLAYTWVRTVELRTMMPGELEATEGGLWRIPKGKMKRRREHLVPLSRQASQHAKALVERSPGSRFVMPNDRRPDRPMSENAILYLLGRIGYAGRMTGHGWRTIASTWANENGWTPDAIERQLAHAPDDETRAIYNTAQYLPERRRMLQAWADWLDEQEAAATRLFHGKQFAP